MASPAGDTGHDRDPPGTALDVTSLTVVLAESVRRHLGTDRGEAGLRPFLRGLTDLLGCAAAAVLRREHAGLVPVAVVGFGTAELPAVLPLELGIAGEAARTARTVRCDDARVDARWFDSTTGRHRSGMAVPMMRGGSVWGVLTLECTDVCSFDAATEALLLPVADELAWALENHRLAEQAIEQARHAERRQRGFAAAAAVITAGLQETEVAPALDRMTREVRERVGWDSLAVLLRDGDEIRVASHYGFAQNIAEATIPADRGIVGRVLMTGRPHLASDTAEDPVYEAVVTSTRSEMTAPLTVAGVVRGVLNAESPHPGAFNDDDLELMTTLADQMSLVLHNLELLSAGKSTVARLHELDRFKTRLFALASHELRTPLTVVLGFAEVIAQHAHALDADRLTGYAEAIARHAGSLGKLVDHMLIASEIEQGALSIVSGRTELLPLVRELDASLGAGVDIGAGLAGCAVAADPYRLRQVLAALLENAVTYAGDGAIQIDAREDGATATILIRDEGPGIPVAEQERVFELFYQVGEHGIAGRRGVGLGLTIARDLVRLMGGELRLASAEGFGVTFLLTLPIAR